MFSQKLVSVIVVNFNGKDFLKILFPSLLKTNYEKFEVILVDNASSDGSIEYIRDNFKDERITIIRNDKNYGPASARNIGFKKAMGEYIAFLDNDTEVDSEWLMELVKAFENDHKIAVAQCKLLNMVQRNRFDHAGDYFNSLGFLEERSKQCIDEGQFNKVEEILSAKSAAVMIKSPIYKELGMFDETYFIFMEETDFCFRVCLRGYKVIFVPKAIVWHAFHTPLKEFKRYYTPYMTKFLGCRNYIMTLLKNLSLGSLFKILPFHILSWLCISVLFLFRGKFTDSILILKGIFWNLFHIKGTIKKRIYVQRGIRRVKDEAIFNKFMKNHSLFSYFRKAMRYLRGYQF